MGRDGCRTPMQWDSTGGFSTSEHTWLPTNPNTKTVNVEAELGDPESTLELYRHLLALRRATPALHAGGFELLPSDPSVLAYKRISDDGEVISVAVNLSSKSNPQPFTGKILASTTATLIGSAASESLGPWEAIVIG